MAKRTAKVEFGNRGARMDRIRWFGAMALLVLLALAEVIVGGKAEREHLARLLPHDRTNWASNRYDTRAGDVAIPTKPAGVKRILYLSNSHARTGGFVSRHLQQLLDGVAPNVYEVLDMSSPGIFAPEMLQRFLMALDYNIDAAVVNVAYISFADRMQLQRQSLSARSFFKPGVFERLDAGFWARNYDVGLYGDTWVARWSLLYRYRSAIRNYWEQPAVASLQQIGSGRIRFLDIDEAQGWRFPTGFDRNLFDWSLYALGRDGHLADMRALVVAAERAKVPLLAGNLPVDWNKEPRRRREDDIAEYRARLEQTFSGATHYVDYQDIFPKDFTTYDALHPTWHGARLHALDVALRLQQQGLLGTVPPARILQQFRESDIGVSVAYREMLGDYASADVAGFRRYDVSEPANARDLMARTTKLPLSHPQLSQYLFDLGWRLRYWLEAPFTYEGIAEYFPPGFDQVLAQEIRNARERARYFQQALIKLRRQQLASFPVPAVAAGMIVLDRHTAAPPKSIERRVVVDDDKYRVVALAANTMKQPFAFSIEDKINRRNYTLTDPLGDASFIELVPLDASSMTVPLWVYERTPSAAWGI